MKFVILAALLSTAVFAEEDLTQAKAQLNESLDKRISHLQEAKSCVNAATTKEALKACRQQMKEKRKALKEEMKGKWKEHKQNKKS